MLRSRDGEVHWWFWSSFFVVVIATPAAHGSSQATEGIKAVAEGLSHSLVFNPLNEARDQAHVFMDTMLGS